jgi:hypothetical protein
MNLPETITARWEGLVLKGCEDPYFASQKR